MFPIMGLLTKTIYRLLINREKVGNFKFNSAENETDVFYKGDSDDGCLELATALGVDDELQEKFEKLKQSIKAKLNKEGNDLSEDD